MVILMSITTGKLPLTLLLIMVIVSAGSLIQLQPASATFPGANGKIVFARNMGSTVDQTKSAKNIATQTNDIIEIPSQWEIFTVNPDGSGLTQLTFTVPGVGNYYPRWSADGTKIVFTSDRAGRSAIWVMNADGSGQTQVTYPPASAKNYQPAFSPDGSKIVFENDSSTVNIWVTNVDGSNQKQLSTPPSGGADAYPVWSPDGSKIAFARYALTPGTNQIYVMNADGSNPTDISKSPSNSDVTPEWSPDGRMIAFTRVTQTISAIWVMNADGTVQKQLSTPPSGSEDLWTAWSPDGTKIAFARGSFASIIVMNADGSNPTDITKSQLDSDSDSVPSWQPILARPVGGVVLPTNKLEILTPYLTLAGLAAALSAVVVVKRRRA